ncbi:MAG TPA: DUF5330 domain-containing protein [Xanthobacteraceae bacterium]|jgi:hypothetical protein
MFFLLRMAFWLGVVLILLPTGGTQRGPAANEVNASEAISAASATVHDLKGFCGREPTACSVGSQFVTTIGYRAQAGAKMLYELLTEALASHDAASPAASQAKPEPAAPSLQRASSENTLTPADLAPAWRGPPARKAI